MLEVFRARHRLPLAHSLYKMSEGLELELKVDKGYQMSTAEEYQAPWTVDEVYRKQKNRKGYRAT